MFFFCKIWIFVIFVYQFKANQYEVNTFMGILQSLCNLRECPAAY